MLKLQPLEEGKRTGCLSTAKTFLPGILGLSLFIFLGLGTEWLFFKYRQERTAELKAATVSHLDKIILRLEGELNAVYYLSYGIADNWVVHQDMSAPEQTRQIFMDVFRHSRHVRRFAVIAGSQVAYVYPPGDEGQAFDVEDKNQAAQWPWFLRNTETRAPLLEWPAAPARGLTFLVPIFEEGRVLGLLGTLIDDSSLFSASGLTQTSDEYEYALRTQRSNGKTAAMMLGTAPLFDDPQALVSNIPIPGGIWQLAVKCVTDPMPEVWPWVLRIVGWLFAALSSALAIALWALNCRLVDQALYDHLTGLPSRHLFLDRLKQVIRRTRRGHGNFSILSVNLDGIESINERKGRKVGDMLLTGIGKRLIGYIRHSDTVTRWKGEEFLVLLDGCPQNQAKIIAENLRHQIELPVYCGEQKLTVRAFIGIATFPDDGRSLAALLKAAEARKVRDSEG